MQSFSYLRSLVISIFEENERKTNKNDLLNFINKSSEFYINRRNHVRFYSELDWLQQCALMHAKGSRTYRMK